MKGFVLHQTLTWIEDSSERIPDGWDSLRLGLKVQAQPSKSRKI